MVNFTTDKETCFAPAERKNKNEIASQAKELKNELKEGLSRELKGKLKGNSILDVTPDPLVILNSERQLIFANRALLNFLQLEDDTSILGLRPGEMFKCVHAENDTGGCGTTEFCSVCGGVKAILATQKDHVENQRECEITTTEDKTYNFRVWTFPFGENIIFVIRDIADEVYRDTLEHIFFHDLINIGSGLFGLLSMVNGNAETFKQYEKLLTGLAEEILEEINSQRDLLMAEQGSMLVNWEMANSIEIMKFVAEVLGRHQAAEDKNIQIDESSEAVDFQTDTRLLKRVIINVVKNALEASETDECVLLKVVVKEDRLIFEVHNNAFIPEDVQLQIFKRSFSTKGRGRGLGAYSIKLLAENYLQGKVYFTSTVEDGTSFFVECPIEPVIEEGRPD